MDKHEWARDPERRGEGYMCRRCGVTEAEMEDANGRMDACTAPYPAAGPADSCEGEGEL